MPFKYSIAYAANFFLSTGAPPMYFLFPDVKTPAFQTSAGVNLSFKIFFSYTDRTFSRNSLVLGFFGLEKISDGAASS